MSLATDGVMSTKWQNSAARRRCHAKYRAALCRILNCPIDSCYTTGELRRDARAAQQEERRERAQIRAEWQEHVEWRDACADMRRREAAWIDGRRS